jgi:hypothetical protein
MPEIFVSVSVKPSVRLLTAEGKAGYDLNIIFLPGTGFFASMIAAMQLFCQHHLLLNIMSSTL